MIEKVMVRKALAASVDIQPELILVGFDQRCDGIVEQLVIGLLLCPEAVVIMLPPSEAAAIRTARQLCAAAPAG